MRRITVAVLASALVAGQIFTAAPALAQAEDLEDLIGMRGSSLDGELARQGYSLARNVGGAQMWWNASRRACVSVYVDQGRVQSIENASASDCGRSDSGGGSNAAAGVVAGALAVGLAAALASHHRGTGDRHRQQADHDREYERGYHDGMYGAHYDNEDSEGYHEGFLAGEHEGANRRAANTDYVRGNVSPAAAAACARRADEYMNLPAGSSVAVGVSEMGRGSFELTMASGRYRSRCTVDSRGRVTGIEPY